MSILSTSPALDVVLRDGSTVSFRRPTEEDVTGVLGLLNGLSPRSRYLRFLGYATLTAERVRPLIVPADGAGRALLVESGGRIVGFAGYQRDRAHGHHAEVAFAIGDAVQGQGIGTRLLEKLAQIARDDGIERFDAEVLGSNSRMLEVFRDSGFATTTTLDHGVYRVAVSLDVTPGFEEKAAARSRIAATESMRPFFEPRVVAVVGASRDRGRIGSEILHNLKSAGFTGAIVPVHPGALEVDGLPAVSRVSEIPGPVDLAIVVVPAPRVLAVVDDCIAKGVRAICVISAGFGECDAEGRAREAALLEHVRTAGCRLIGPNCMGLLNTAADVRLNGTFSPVYPPAGNVAMSTQSGALGLAILDYARRLGIGISSFVSVGNKADVSSNDLIQYWAEDPNTDVILLYLESFGNPKKFSEIARRVGRSKPIVAVKAGRSAAGSRAAASHTGALASSDTAIDALFRQAGVIRTERLEELFDVAALLAHQPLPAGRRVAILTNAGGPGILAADACEANGLELPALSAATRAELSAFLPAAAAVGNPVDMLASAPADHYGRALAALLKDDNVDSVITIFIPPLVTEPDAVARAIVEASRGAMKPVLGVFMRADGAPPSLAPIPSYAFPESAAQALARSTAYAEWRRTPLSAPPLFDRIDPEAVWQVRGRVLARGGGWTTAEENLQLLSAVGIDVPPARVVKTPDEAVAAATSIGYPVAIKALGPALLHKTERRAVHLNLENEGGLRLAFTDFTRRFGSEMTSVLVQRMVPPGVEMIVGVVHDPLFGPLIACGTGGTMVDVFQDVQFRLHPLTAADVGGMLDSLKGIRLLRGFRGASPADESALRSVLLRVSALLTLVPQIQELDINPVIVLESGAWAADVRVRIASSPIGRSGRRVEY